MRRGFILVEVSVAYLVLSLALVTLIPVFILALRSAKNMEQITAATQLSSQLLEEISLGRWDRGTPNPPVYVQTPAPLGVDAGESAADKRTFDDIDDFDGWTEPAPLDPVMRPLEGFSAYKRSVTVAYVDSSLAPVTGPTDYKHISVCTSTIKLKPSCVDTIFTNR
jgi:type II secretory pathway pseudopilin PulG